MIQYARHFCRNVSSIDLPTCIDTCRSAELAAVQLKAIADPEPQEPDIHLMKRKFSDRRSRIYNKSKVSDMKQVKCDYCGENYLKGRDHCSADSVTSPTFASQDK